MKLYRIGVRLFLLSMFIVACNSETTPEIGVSVVSTPAITHTSPLPSPTVRLTLSPLIVESGQGGVQGHIEIQRSNWVGELSKVYFCPFTPDQSGVTGIYILEPSIHPKAKLQDGYFQIGNVPPGKYVLVVGPGPEVAIPIREDGQIKVFEVVKDQTLEISANVY